MVMNIRSSRSSFVLFKSSYSYISRQNSYVRVHSFKLAGARYTHAKTTNMTDTTMQQANVLRKAMDGPSPSFGAWQMLPGSNVSRTIARSGFEWILVDCEHGNIDDAAMHEAVAAIAACGVSPIVRIPDNQGWMVKRT